MRRTIKHLLARHKYPADSRDNIIDLLVEQAGYFDGMVI